MFAVAVVGRSVRCAICEPLRYRVSVPPDLVTTQCTQPPRLDCVLFGCRTYSVPFSHTPAYAAVVVPGRASNRTLPTVPYSALLPLVLFVAPWPRLVQPSIEKSVTAGSAGTLILLLEPLRVTAVLPSFAMATGAPSVTPL